MNKEDDIMKTEKNNKNNILITVLLVFVAFVGGAAWTYLILNSFEQDGNVIKSVSNVNIKEQSIADAVDKVYDAVVVVVAYKDEVKQSTGTGFVYKKNDNVGYIMTNNHVIDGANSVKVIMSDGSVVDAKIIGGETYCDIAVLTIDASKVKTIATVGKSEDSRLGDIVFTIGSPMGELYSGTVTKGILSGKDRLVEVSFSNSQTSDYYMKVLQTDAAINPGNSGGPLLNVNGEVIGINSLKLVKDEIEGMGFAIPIEDAIYYAGIIENGETIKRPYIGISMIDISDEYSLWRVGIKVPDNVEYGVAILEVVSSSPAFDAGLKSGDIITKIEDTTVNSVAMLRYELYKHAPGDTIEVKYNRNGTEHTAKIKLKEQS